MRFLPYGADHAVLHVKVRPPAVATEHTSTQPVTPSAYPAIYRFHEELLRLAAAGHADFIRHMLRVTALAEIRIYRDVSQAVMANVGHILGWSRPKAAILAAVIQTVYFYERPGGWRRMVTLRPPARRNALGGPPRASSESTRASSSHRLRTIPPMRQSKRLSVM